MKIGTKEHYDLMAAFERDHSGYRLDREAKDFWPKGHVYQNGETNALFLAYRNGASFAKAYHRDDSSTPANPAQGVSEAMVEAARDICVRDVGVESPSRDTIKDALTAAIGAGAEDPRWQKLRDLFGLDGWHDGLWSGIPNPDQIITHVEHIANERARLLKAHTDAQPEAAIGAGGQAVAADRQRIDDALVSCAGLLRVLCKDEIGDTAAAELEYVRSALSQPHPADERAGMRENVAYFTDDKWGGYWQTVRDGKPYNFRIGPHPADERVVEALVQATRKYTHETLFIDEHRDLIRAALAAGKE